MHRSLPIVCNSRDSCFGSMFYFLGCFHQFTIAWINEVMYRVNTSESSAAIVGQFSSIHEVKKRHLLLSVVQHPTFICIPHTASQEECGRQVAPRAFLSVQVDVVAEFGATYMKYHSETCRSLLARYFSCSAQRPLVGLGLMLALTKLAGCVDLGPSHSNAVAILRPERIQKGRILKEKLFHESPKRNRKQGKDSPSLAVVPSHCLEPEDGLRSFLGSHSLAPLVIGYKWYVICVAQNSGWLLIQLNPYRSGSDDGS